MQESQMSLQDLQTGTTNFDPTVTHDDFLNQLLSGLQTTVSWPDPPTPDAGDPQTKPTLPWNPDHFDHQSTFLSSKLHHHHITTTAESPIFQNKDDSSSIHSLFHGFTGSLTMQNQNFGSPVIPEAAVMSRIQAGSATVGGGGGGGGVGAPSQPPQRVRARRGQATDPHSIAERLRRERIAERMKALQELVPNANKTDKATMLDDIIDYVKFLQLQVKVLSMSRLGGVSNATVAAEAADGEYNKSGGGPASSTNNETTIVTENQVVKLMEEDMGSAMQYLQGKGLCLMPISLATAISTVRCHLSSSRNNHHFGGGEGGGPCSPNVSVLTVQSANGVPVKDSP